MGTLGYSNDSYNYDQLFSGDFPVVSQSVTVLSGENVVRGSVMGVDDDGKYLLSLSAATDGSETPTAILANDVDASLGDKVGIVYVTGQYNVEKLTIGTGHTAASIKAGLRALSIFIENPVKA